MSAKHKVSTDALDTLGSIIDETQKRDAIHLAVAPAVAVVKLFPGQDVGLVEGGAGPSDEPVGIVDPFLKGAVQPGQRFWLVVYPRVITSLRHVWCHPAFDDEAPAEAGKTMDADPVSVSRAWIEQFAADIDQTYSRLMQAAADWLRSGDYTYDNSESYKEHWDKFPEFWAHYAIVNDVLVPEDQRESFFSCSC